MEKRERCDFMNNTYYENEVRQLSRSEKIRLAKSAFSQDRVTGGLEKELNFEEGKHHYGMFRMVAAGVLFFVLVLSFHFDVSYNGYNKTYVKQMLSDNSHLEMLMEQVVQVMNQAGK